MILPPAITWEVLVVDNNSNDQTATVTDEFRGRYPVRFQYIFEPSQGKSFALNAGILAATGRVLAFIDDDVVASPRWLQNLTANILSGKCSGAGGKILLDPNFAPPAWLPVEGPLSLAGMLAVFDLGNESRPLDRPPFGTNMAFVRTMFEKYGLFRTDMGPAPGSEIRNEDVEFCRRLMSGGEVLQYEPESIVYHAVPERRRTQEYFLQFWFDHGRAVIRETGERSPVIGIPHRYLSIVKAVYWSIPVSTLRWLCTRDTKPRFYRKGWVWMLAGQVSEWSRTASGRRTGSRAISETASRGNLTRNAQTARKVIEEPK